MPYDALARGFVATQIGESLANYPMADKPLQDRADLAGRQLRSDEFVGTFDDDGRFWERRFQEHATQGAGAGVPDMTRGRKVGVFYAAVSEWLARVPGLYWRPGSSNLRALCRMEIEAQTDEGTTYTPKGKSEHVSGGIGTLRFPPSDDGYRLVTLTTSYNASAGVPALISPDVWEAHRLAEGTLIQNGAAHWREMPQRWAEQFPVVRSVPRGCLILDDVRAINSSEKGAPIQIHPFSVMEYWKDTAQLLDFVYATADSGDPKFRAKISAFFERYRKDRDRDGNYLLAADISDPMWDATFTSPNDIRTYKPAQFRLLEERIKDAATGQDVAEALVAKLSKVDSVADLKRLSQDAGIEWRRWSEGGLVAQEAARLVAKAIETDKQQALLQAVLLEFGP